VESLSDSLRFPDTTRPVFFFAANARNNTTALRHRKTRLGESKATDYRPGRSKHSLVLFLVELGQIAA